MISTPGPDSEKLPRPTPQRKVGEPSQKPSATGTEKTNSSKPPSTKPEQKQDYAGK